MPKYRITHDGHIITYRYIAAYAARSAYYATFAYHCVHPYLHIRMYEGYKLTAFGKYFFHILPLVSDITKGTYKDIIVLNFIILH